MRLSVSFACSLAALTICAPLSAEPTNPNPELFAKSGYTRQPAVAADKRPIAFTGPLEPWNGSALWQMLTWCGAMHANYGLRAKQGGADATILAEQDRLSAHYYDLAAQRLSGDRGIGADAAGAIMESEDVWWSFSFFGQPYDYKLNAMECRLMESRNRMAGH